MKVNYECDKETGRPKYIEGFNGAIGRIFLNLHYWGFLADKKDVSETVSVKTGEEFISYYDKEKGKEVSKEVPIFKKELRFYTVTKTVNRPFITEFIKWFSIPCILISILINFWLYKNEIFEYDLLLMFFGPNIIFCSQRSFRALAMNKRQLFFGPILEALILTPFTGLLISFFLKTDDTYIVKLIGGLVVSLAFNVSFGLLLGIILLIYGIIRCY